MFLKEAEIAELQGIRRLVESKSDCRVIEEACSKCTLEDKLFAKTYAGVLLACHGRVADAVQFLNANSDALSKSLAEFLSQTGKFEASAVAFADSSPYDAFTKTEFYNSYTQAKLATIKDFARKYPPADRQLNIIDIGTGNGVFIADTINELSNLFPLDKCKITIIEQSKGMNEAARAHLEKSLRLPVTINSIEARIENLSAEELKERVGSKYWFIHAGLSLHHMPYADKVKSLGNLRGLAEHFLITENNANHDLPEKDTPEFVYSVYKNYSYYIGNVFSSSISDAEKRSCNHDFLLAEAITMLKNEYKHRVDYHATVEQWTKYAQEAGYKVESITDTVKAYNRPMAFTMHLRSNS